MTKFRAIPGERVRRRFSASQVELFRSCPRKWYLQYVCGVKGPPTASQDLGTRVHAAFEEYLTTGSLPGSDGKDDEVLAIAQPALRNLPKPGKDLLVEHEFWLPLGPADDGQGGTVDRTMYGLIDLAHARDLPQGILTIRDHKTTKDFVWNKTPAELLRNTQANVYAWWGYSLRRLPFFPVPPTEDWRFAFEDGVDVVDFGHHAVKTTRPLGSTTIDVRMPYEKVAAEWVKIQSDVDEMSALALEGPSDPLGVPGNASACDAYGGCHFGCGRRGIGFCRDMVDADLAKRIRTAQEEKEMETKAMSIRERLAARKAAQSGATAPEEKKSEEQKPPASTDKPHVADLGAAPAEPGASPTPGSSGAVGIVPEDAPPREQSAEDAAAAAPPARTQKRAAQKRAGKTVGAAAQAAAPTPEKMVEAEKKTESAAGEVREKLAATPQGKVPAIAPPSGAKFLFVDCLPVDSALFAQNFGASLTPIERWLDPIKRAVAEEFGEVDYQLIEFGKGKGALAAAIAATIDSMPAIAYVSSFSRSADLVIDAALAGGWLVFKATRG